mmetsp:Transcript_75278/g.220461  ORF Transcript_75278/g.220461 Transcript_75278/m.220461 type:complete len:257 (-) Transcript_75278:3-773(-)
MPSVYSMAFSAKAPRVPAFSFIAAANAPRMEASSGLSVSSAFVISPTMRSRSRHSLPGKLPSFSCAIFSPASASYSAFSSKTAFCSSAKLATLAFAASRASVATSTAASAAALAAAFSSRTTISAASLELAVSTACAEPSRSFSCAATASSAAATAAFRSASTPPKRFARTEFIRSWYWCLSPSLAVRLKGAMAASMSWQESVRLAMARSSATGPPPLAFLALAPAACVAPRLPMVRKEVEPVLAERVRCLEAKMA